MREKLSKLKTLFSRKTWLVVCLDENPAPCVAELTHEPTREEVRAIIEDYDGKKFAVVEQKGDRERILFRITKRDRGRREDEEIPKRLDREEITQRIRDQIEKVKTETNKLKKLKAEFEKMFGEEPITDVEIRNPFDGIMKGLGEGAYRGLRKRDDEIADSVIGVLKGLSATLHGLGAFLSASAGRSRVVTKSQKKTEKREERGCSNVGIVGWNTTEI